MNHMPPRPLLAGDHAPVCFGVAADGSFYSFEEQYGRPVVLVLAGADSRPAVSAAVRSIVRQQAAFAERDADVLILVDDNPALVWPGACPLRIVDTGNFLVRCGAGPPDVQLLVLDRAMRVALRPEVDDGADAAAACLACIDAMPREVARDIAQPAPVIVLPNLLSDRLCRALIDRFETGPTIDGEVARVDAAGVVRSVVDHRKKHRRDMAILPEETLHRQLEGLLLDRCAPEIARAFQVQVRHIDRILVSRYDDTGGWFRRHRDNAADNVAFREFALSVNLNTGEYDGGHVLFPEYNDHRYRPPAGAGVIFSTAVLHEAAPVTRGRRYVLLTFLHSDAAEARRLDYHAPAGTAGQAGSA